MSFRAPRAIFLVAFLASCATEDFASQAPPSPPPASAAVETRTEFAEALALLDAIVVEPEQPAGYERDDWPHWLDPDDDCMNVRHEVLLAESIEPYALSPDGCDVVGGLWFDPFTARSVTDPRDLDVDHFVPLAEAHRSGGHSWDRERRAAFANDLRDPRTLIAVTASANRSKGDRGPDEWLPPDVSYRCRYSADWVAVKAEWDLSMDEQERIAVSRLLEECARRDLAS